MEALLQDGELWKTSAELRRFFAGIEALGVGEYVSFDASVVRGLQYYTGTVFEAWEVGGEIRRSLLGGGRYDNLLSDVGGGPVPAVGFALGDVVMTLLLEKYGLLPHDLHVYPASILVTVFDAEHQGSSMRLAGELRRAGLAVALYPDAEKLARQFKYADRIEALVAIVIGPDEVRLDQVTLKNLKTGTQSTIDRSAIVDACKRVLEDAQGR